MLVLQASTLCLTLCIFSLQTDSSFGETENNPQIVNDDVKIEHPLDVTGLWQNYGCKDSPAPEKQFAKLNLCLWTLINQLILRILQDHSPTPLPDHLIVKNEIGGFEGQIQKYAETYMPALAADEEQLNHVFEQVNEFILTPMIKYLNQFPMHAATAQEEADLNSLREDIANILKKYMKGSAKPAIPVVATSFQQNLPTIISYLAKHAPDMIENLGLLNRVLHLIKEKAFKELPDHSTDITALPTSEYNKIVSEIVNIIKPYRKNEEYNIILPYYIHNFANFKPFIMRYFSKYLPDLFADKKTVHTVLKQIEQVFEVPEDVKRDNRNGLDKGVLLKFVELYYPDQFGDRPFMDELIQNYDSQPESTDEVSGPENHHFKDALLKFFEQFYPNLSVKEEVVDQFTVNYELHRRSNVDSIDEVTGAQTISPEREELEENVEQEAMNDNGESESYRINNDDEIEPDVEELSGMEQVTTDLVPMTTPIPEEELEPDTGFIQRAEFIPEEEVTPAPEFVTEAEFIPEAEFVTEAEGNLEPEFIPSRRIVADEFSIDSTADPLMNEDTGTESAIVRSDTAESAQNPTASDGLTVREKILGCIKESFPHIYADKVALRKILQQIESNILSETRTPDATPTETMNIETQIRRFAKEHLPADEDVTEHLPADDEATEHSPEIVVSRRMRENVEVHITPRSKAKRRAGTKLHIQGRGIIKAKVETTRTKQGSKSVVQVHVDDKSKRRENKQDNIQAPDNNENDESLKQVAEDHQEGEQKELAPTETVVIEKQIRRFMNEQLPKYTEATADQPEQNGRRRSNGIKKINVSKTVYFDPDIAFANDGSFSMPGEDQQDNKEFIKMVKNKLREQELQMRPNIPFANDESSGLAGQGQMQQDNKEFIKMVKNKLREQELQMRPNIAFANDGSSSLAGHDQMQQDNKEFIKMVKNKLREQELQNRPNIPFANDGSFSMPGQGQMQQDNTEFIKMVKNKLRNKEFLKRPNIAFANDGSFSFTGEDQSELDKKEFIKKLKSKLRNKEFSKRPNIEFGNDGSFSFTGDDQAELDNKEFIKKLKSKLRNKEFSKRPNIAFANDESFSFTGDDQAELDNKEFIKKLKSKLRNKEFSKRPNIEFGNDGSFSFTGDDQAELDNKEFIKKLKSKLRNKEFLTRPKLVVPKLQEMTPIRMKAILRPRSATGNERNNDYVTSEDNDRSRSFRFSQGNSFLPLSKRTYKRLTEKKQNGEVLTRREQRKLRLLQRMFSLNPVSGQSYKEKYGGSDNRGRQAGLYNRYRMKLKKNRDRFLQIDRFKNIRIPKWNRNQQADFGQFGDDESVPELNTSDLVQNDNEIVA